MIYKKISNTDLTVSAVSLGTDVYGTDLSVSNSEMLLDFYTEMGGNIIDTAKIYADWANDEKSQSEKLIGKWLKKKNNRHNLIISTKGGHPNLDTMNISRLSRDELRSDLESSLKNLRTDYIDIYWLHRDDINIPVIEIANTLNEFVKSGKVRYVGLSNWTAERIDEFNRYALENNLAPAVASQIQYSIAEPNYENNDPTLVIMNDTEYKYYKKHDICVFAFASQAKGFFSKLDKGGISNLSEKARIRYLNEKSLKTYEEIKKLSEETGYSVGKMVIAKLTNNHDFLTIPIVGCKNTIQLKESLEGAEIIL